ncbi:glycosyltransferase [Draconibacterium sp.]|jgi:glycosyltransferase involved in cell wall biosynthesis
MAIKVSVLMSTYNEPEKWLNDSINSILEQSFHDFELILINDNPQRKDLKIILANYATLDKRIKLIENQENLGLMRSFNVGIDNCSGKYIARMDADDISMPNRLEIQVDFMENNPEIGVCGTFAKTFGVEERILATPVSDTEIRDSIIDCSPFIHPTVIIRKSIFDDPEVRYRELHGAEDYGLWVDLLGKTKFHNINRILLKYRISKQQVSHKNKGQKEVARNVKKRGINFIFGETVANEIYNGKEITLLRIKKIKRLIPAHISRKSRDVLIENLYLSLDRYTLYTAIHYLLQEKNPKVKIFLKLVKRVFKHDLIFTRLQVHDGYNN